MKNLRITELLEQFKAETKQQAIRLIAQRSDRITATSSKFGGLPYLPKNFAYPTDKKGNPLKLLAQLNFAEFPPLADFPTGGILQFFVLHDDTVGFDGNDYKVLYHKEIHENDRMTAFPEVKFVGDPIYEDDTFPFKGEFAVTGELVDVFPNYSETTFFKTKFKSFCEKYDIVSHFETLFWGKEEWQNYRRKPYDKGLIEKSAEIDRLLGKFFGAGFERHTIGGYPFFCQLDPREVDENLGKYDTVLFQMSSYYDKNDHNNTIMWGDMGVANFMINLADLRNLKFDDVQYNWDCC